MPKIKTNAPKSCKHLVGGMTCMVGLALAGLLQEWVKNWPVKKWLR